MTRVWQGTFWSALAGVVLLGCSDAGGDPPPPVEAGESEAQFAALGEETGPIQVYKSPTCGCCAKWVEHLRSAGFEVEIHDTDQLATVKAENGVPPSLQSCHTATVDGYVIEGHVPVDVIARLLEERPEVSGLAVPGMPIGSPGMEMGSRQDPYEVVTFDEAGETTVYERR